MKSDPAPLEDTGYFLTKPCKHSITMQSSKRNPCLLKEVENMYTLKPDHRCLEYFFYSCQKLEAIKISFLSEWVSKTFEFSIAQERKELLKQTMAFGVV